MKTKTTGFDCMKCGCATTYGVVGTLEDSGQRMVHWECCACDRASVIKREEEESDGVPLPESLVTWLAGDLCCQRPHVPPVDTGWIVDGPRFSLRGPTYVDEDEMVAHLTDGDK